MTFAPNHVTRSTYTVRSLEIDARGRASVVALLGMLQESAGVSAHELGFSVERLLRDGITWVLARFRLEMTRWPAWRDEITVATWPSGADAARAYRDFRVHDAAGAEIGRAESLWMVLDLATRRPTRIPEFVLALRGSADPEPRPALAPLLRRDDPPGEADTVGREFHVRWSDLDLNDHANNVCYVEWALETVPTALRAEAFPARLAIDFRAEARLGDTIRATGSPLGPHAFAHRVVNASTGRDLALVETTWSAPLDQAPRMFNPQST